MDEKIYKPGTVTNISDWLFILSSISSSLNIRVLFNRLRLPQVHMRQYQEMMKL